MINNNNLTFNEKATFELRNLYSSRGYSQYKMSKFEEYDLYARNKDFLISDSVITFTDTNGKLMALKPDVTLSIVKNTKDIPGYTQKVYYDENVYRISKGTNTYKEIMQIGLECIGDIDSYNICEVITLACKSLKSISDNCVLDISHLGIITALMDAFSIPSYAKSDLLKYIGEKNPHELVKLCSELELSYENTELLKTIATTSGNPNVIIPDLKEKLDGIIDNNLINDLSLILSSLSDDIKDIVRIDFSVVSDTHYYNAIVFKGFIEGIPTSVLSGGQYDKLLQKMKRKSGAIGFAVYLDMLDMLIENKNEYDIDVLLIYSDNSNLSYINSKINTLNTEGKSVLASKTLPENIKYKEIINIQDCEVG